MVSGQYCANRLWLAALLVVLAVPGYAAFWSRKKTAGPVEEVHQSVIRFAGRASERVDDVVREMEPRLETRESLIAALEIGLGFYTAALDIATGPNPDINLIDMVVLVSLEREIIETYWVPKVLGNPGKPLLRTMQELESEIWSMASKLLTPAQKRDLRILIQRWREQHPDQVYVEAMRFGDFAPLAGQTALAKANQPGGLFGTKRVTRSVDETRLLGERAMFYAQRAPSIARAHARLLMLQATVMPETKKVLADTDVLTKSISALAVATETLPAQIRREREAAMSQLAGTIATERDAAINQVMTKVTAERKATVADISGLIQRERIETIRQVMPQVRAERIAAIEQVMDGVTLQRQATIHEVADRISQDSIRMAPHVQAAASSFGSEGRALVDYIFYRATLLIAILLVGSVAAGLIYRFASDRISTNSRADRPIRLT